MALAAGLGKAGHSPKRVHTTADVTIDKVGEGFKITKIVLKTEGEVPGIDEKTFKEFAEKTKTGCPVSPGAVGDADRAAGDELQGVRPKAPDLRKANRRAANA